ncbi:Alpha-thujene synthase TPS3, chloroplastic [Linum grandiflorum]
MKELKEYVKGLIEEKAPMANDEKLEMIDSVQRLGLGYHFDKEIHTTLQQIASSDSSESLCATALRFRLSRQAGISVFPDENGKFKHEIAKDTEGLLELYEASYLAVKGEEIMDDAKAFAVRHLTEIISTNLESDSTLGKRVTRALHLPLNWRMQRAETKWFIELYQQQQTERHDTTLLELAKSDFNAVQRVHQKELEELTRWWKDLGLMEHMEFARDPLVESFLWAVGMTSHPEMGDCRKAMTKVAIIVHIIDDVYDVYGFIDELELFTAAIERWDIKELDKLPGYMQLCFMAVYNIGNQTCYGNLKRQGLNTFPYIQKAWVDLCRSYMEEAKAYRSGSDQTLEQYLNIAWTSVGCDVVLIHGYLSNPSEILTHETLDVLSESDPNLTRLTSIVVRLTNDLASSKGELERGDVLKAVECYMRENNVSEEFARDHVNGLIDETWKMMNVLVASMKCLPPTYVDLAVDVARASHYMYKHGISKGLSSTFNDKDTAVSLLFEPI